MLERLTFLLGVCVSVIGWLFTSIAADITSVPVIYFNVAGEIHGVKNSSIVYSAIDVENLSSRFAAPPMKMVIHGTNADGAGCIKDRPDPIGATWTQMAPAPSYRASDPANAGVDFTKAIMPGATFKVLVQIDEGCKIQAGFDVSDNAAGGGNQAVRILTQSYEADINPLSITSANLVACGVSHHVFNFIYNSLRCFFEGCSHDSDAGSADRRLTRPFRRGVDKAVWRGGCDDCHRATERRVGSRVHLFGWAGASRR